MFGTVLRQLLVRTRFPTVCEHLILSLRFCPAIAFSKLHSFASLLPSLATDVLVFPIIYDVTEEARVARVSISAKGIW